ncbi:uncharacterized protein N7459_008475 [Penicillium hispanicum]|uniref:uncharacterized protein n=1 Tax=Penicillium hispanicum TaxID=1080232 RepID=UPI00254098EB|nr:uncharacterized protein N7459_008475 [Penicillium hispanicum]KAJ5574048.1 hypothetical protein N7459_008475 [Penicillium hispanicum]
MRLLFSFSTATLLFLGIHASEEGYGVEILEWKVIFQDRGCVPMEQSKKTLSKFVSPTLTSN